VESSSSEVDKLVNKHTKLKKKLINLYWSF
jgi:hypothetical protein